MRTNLQHGALNHKRKLCSPHSDANRFMCLTSVLAAWTRTIQEPSLTMWLIFPNASSTSRISSLDEGMGTMLMKADTTVEMLDVYQRTNQNKRYETQQNRPETSFFRSNVWSYGALCLPLRIELAEHPHHPYRCRADLLIVVRQQPAGLQRDTIASSNWNGVS